jgi:spore cortex formation protein SpoVR/YcgB (stage V sporulation)
MYYKNYSTNKTRGLVEIVKAGGGYALAKKQYSSETGELQEPIITSVDVDKLNDRKTELQNEIAQIDEIIADIQSISKK